jgi:prefoldin subunit 5
LVETLDQNIRILQDKIENLSVRTSLIENKLSTIDKLQNQLATIATLDISKIDRILDILQNIDLKT